MKEKIGIQKLGFVKNLTLNQRRQNYLSVLSKLVGRKVKADEVDAFIESDEFKLEYIDKDGNIAEKETCTGFRFKLPWPDTDGNDLYGHFGKTNNIFMGVTWGGKKISIPFNLKKYGYIDPTCWERLKSICGYEITENRIGDYITSRVQFYNGAGHTTFDDGTIVTLDTCKFIKFSTNISFKGGTVVGWFTKNIRGRFEGISWGSEKDFKSAQKIREKFYVGRMVFDAIDDCNIFLENLKKKTIPEPWEYKRKKDEKIKYPILKSYLEFELDRLFYEQDAPDYPDDRIILNKEKNQVLFNTNLIDKFGHDLIIVGTCLEIANKIYIADPIISPSRLDLRKRGFDSSIDPMPPMFFKDINEIIFHSDWEIDKNMDKYEHIIELRIERFPEKYQGLPKDELGRKLDYAINLAQKIAQRNYKFIVPMYYPTHRRIQLLMPIFLESSLTPSPDFALVLTPNTNEKIYTPETILGLEEVYQDARLIAKPEESWLNPGMIE